MEDLNDSNENNNNQFLTFLLGLQKNQQLTLNDLIQQRAMQQLSEASASNARNTANMVQNIQYYNIQLQQHRPQSTPPNTDKGRRTKSTNVSETSSEASDLSFSVRIPAGTVEVEEKEKTATKKKNKVVSVKEQKIMSIINFVYYMVWFLFALANSALVAINTTNPGVISPLYFEIYSAIGTYLNVAYPFIMNKLKDCLRNEYDLSGMSKG